MNILILFLFGLVVGSFLNVVSLRYRPDIFLFGKHIVGGRSQCPQCEHELRWHELIPVASFLLQARKCRKCQAKISWQYPIVELVAGLIFVLVPGQVAAQFCQVGATSCGGLSALWVLAFLLLLLVFIIDLRHQIIPDELNALLGLVGIATAIFSATLFGLTEGSFLGAPALLAGLRDSLLVNRLVAALVVSGAFLFIVLISRGRGMGLGDVKLAIGLGLLFGWPDIVAIAAVAFVVGAVVGAVYLLFGKAHLKSAVAFGPFLVLGSAVVFFWGEAITRWYLSLIGF